MIIDKLLKDIIYFARDFYSSRNVSMYTLLKESEYYESSDLINEENLYETLKKYPDSVEHWYTMSDDSKANPSWILTEEDGFYKVWFYPPEKGYDTVRFNDRYRACAAYISRYLNRMCKHFKAEVLSSRNK